MQNYLDLLRKVLEKGDDKKNRTGIDTRGLFGEMLKFDLREGFPAVTTKKLFFPVVAAELEGFIKGYDSAAAFREAGCNIWDQNANENAEWLANKSRKGKDDLGRIYGVQWRDWTGVRSHDTYFAATRRVDQLAEAVRKVKEAPNDRRNIVTAWNPAEIDQMALPPCHILSQLYVDTNNTVHMTMYQRSCDMFLGVPFNIASYALLLSLIAKVTGREAGTLTMMLGDVHIYHNHFAQVNEQLLRTPTRLPTLSISPGLRTLDDIVASDCTLVDYHYCPAIKAPMAV